uniref:Reverse transcriptase zinc-binding domain-containing protein n=1 Tax=Quercus lobata TaxID=97700 RepID=A0A7N2R5Q9_QUELO
MQEVCTRFLYWLHTKSGEYTVRSGYYIARQIAEEKDEVGECSRTGMSGLIWNMLWKLKIPNKIKIFGWRAWNNALPTRENLFKRRVVHDARCELIQKRWSMCFGSVELLRTFWLVAEEVCTRFLYWLHTKSGEYTVRSGYYIARQIAKEKDEVGECSRTGMSGLIWNMLWKLKIPNKIKIFGWRAWNNALPTRENLFKRRVVHDVRCELIQKRWSMCFGSVELLRTFWLVAEFKDSQVHLAIPVSVGAVQRWRPPSGSVYKVNFDASVFASTDSSGGPFGVYKRGSRSFSLQEGSRVCC